MADSKLLQKTPCYQCIVRPACQSRKTIICGKLACYLCPGYVVLRQRILRIRKLLPRVDYVKYPTGGWVDIPYDLVNDPFAPIWGQKKINTQQ